MCNLCLKDQTLHIKQARSLLRNVPRFTLEERALIEGSEKFLKQHLLDRVFINNVINLSYLSHCVSRQVGCVIALDGRTLVTGVNGTSQGDVNCDELFPLQGFDPVAHRKWSDDNEIHAELNAINFAAKHGISLDGATLYCSLQPCMQCSKNLPAVGIKRIVFDTFYDRVDNFQEQVEYLARKGVTIEKLLTERELYAKLSFLFDNFSLEKKMLETYVERFPSRVIRAIERVDFDATNPRHRYAAMVFFKHGTWEIKFNTRWPCVTVPQTVLMALAEYACQDELAQLAVNDQADYKFGDPFNLHTVRTSKIADNVVDIHKDREKIA